MLKVCERAARESLPVFLYGSTTEVLADAGANLLRRYPTLKIVGTEPSKFRRLSGPESKELTERIRATGASVVFAALGCPRQEVWAYEFRERLHMPVLAVGAAFPFIAGRLKQAPPRMQRLGLEWLFRLWTEPWRLWRRYLLLNPAYLSLLALQATKIRVFQSTGVPPTTEWNYG
jgi:N-acetylglucosaminyldiphosphoundecaprenol N-acetyl-beta-D-mannosaminyltransferase